MYIDVQILQDIKKSIYSNQPLFVEFHNYAEAYKDAEEEGSLERFLDNKTDKDFIKKRKENFETKIKQ